MSASDDRGDVIRRGDSLHLRGSEILCEECGSVYDLRTGTGLCRFCAEEEARIEEGPTDDD